MTLPLMADISQRLRDLVQHVDKSQRKEVYTDPFTGCKQEVV